MAIDPNLPAANYFPDYSTAGGYVAGQVESTNGGYVPGSDATAAATAAKYADPTNIGPDFTPISVSGNKVPGELAIGASQTIAPNWNASSTIPDQSYTDPSNLSSMPTDLVPAEPIINGTADNRVKLMIPQSYQILDTAKPRNQLKLGGGIVFPYTPTISLEHKANYTNVNVPHSNYTQYFYKNSSVSEITISGKFTVQNEAEAGLYIAITHLLRALTKMRFGNDTNAGSPPPVCRLMAYGDYMLNNVPVAVASFKVDLPDSVDYFRTGYTVTEFGYTSVPVVSTIQLTLLPIYSRAEMLKGTVTDWLTKNQRVQGYL